MSTQPDPTPVTPDQPSVGDAAMSPLQNPAFWTALATIVSVILVYLVPTLGPHADSIAVIITTLGAIVTTALGAAHVKGSPHGVRPS